MYIIGVDVGGTNIKCGLVYGNEIISRIEVPTNTFDLVKQIVNLVKRILDENALTASDINGVGVGFPGLVVDGVVLDSSNIGLKDFDLQKALQEELNINTKVINDGSLAVLAEHKFGAGDNLDNIVMITIGTGIGGGIIANGKLYEGNGGGELGHILYEKNGLPCGCGRCGCAEQYVSYSALIRRAKKAMESMENSIVESDNGLSAGDILLAYKKGDICAKEIIENYIDDLCEVLLDYCNVFRPNKIIIGGGLSHFDEIINKVADKCKIKNYGYHNSPSIEIVSAKLKNSAAIIGASVLFN